jgi:protein-tyrosine phosphatase
MYTACCYWRLVLASGFGVCFWCDLSWLKHTSHETGLTWTALASQTVFLNNLHDSGFSPDPKCLPNAMSVDNSVLFVCMGNICRSPAAAAVLATCVGHQNQRLALQIDSAGTHGFNIGHAADPRMRHAASRRGYSITSQARQVNTGDLQRFDLIVAMDRENLIHLEAFNQQVADPRQARFRLFSDFLGDNWPDDVPDPYHGGDAGFEYVLDMIEAGCPAILQAFREQRF